MFPKEILVSNDINAAITLHDLSLFWQSVKEGIYLFLFVRSDSLSVNLFDKVILLYGTIIHSKSDAIEYGHELNKSTENAK